MGVEALLDMTTELKVIQLNLNRAELAQVELLQRINNEGSKIAIIQEPYVYKNRLIKKPKGFDCFPTVSRERPRAAPVSYTHLTLPTIYSV